MITIQTNSRKDIFVHIGIIVCLLLMWFLGFFFIYLPSSTHHGESITVPDLNGRAFDDAVKFLEEHDLRYEVSDSAFQVGKKPLTVLSQYPKPGAKVKQNRKIYLTIVAKNPPMVRMPKLVDLSLQSAELQLQSFDLVPGEYQYKADLAENTILEQRYKGTKIEPGTEIPKGSKIDLVVSNGQGAEHFPVPSLIGLSLEEVRFYLKGASGVGLQLGNIIYEEREGKPLGKVFKQNPASIEGNTVRAGDIIDIWIAGKSEDSQPQVEGGENTPNTPKKEEKKKQPEQ
jgi:beta-lactam-binding protein with PASTA domain